MYLVVCYDVTCDRRRARLLKKMKGFLPHVQKSVFEGPLDPERFEPLRQMIRSVIDLGVDTVRIYHLCGRCVPATEIFGTGQYVCDEEEDHVV